MKKKFRIFIQKYFVPILVFLYVKFLQLTSKFIFHYPKEVPKENFILLMWHREGLMHPINYHQFKKNGVIKSIISEHRDGDMIKNIFLLLGIGSISGSSTRGGSKALINAIKNIKNNISDVAITPDGPKGPVYSIASGAVVIAQKTKAKIYIAHYKASSFWELNSWDKYIIPKPFGIINFYISEPLDIGSLSIEEANKLIKTKMMENIDV